MTTTHATDRLDAAFAEFLLARERDPALLPGAFAQRLSLALRGPFLGEIEGLGEIDRLTARPAPGLPERIGRHRVIARLGQGAMGTVYEAEQCGLGRRVAVKVLRSAGDRDGDLVARFRREAHIIASLHHESIVAVHDVDEHEGRPVLVMQLASGASLAELLAARRVPSHASHALAKVVLGDARRVARTFARIASALAYAHDRGVVHRDLKPANIVIDEHGHPTVLDFGLARSLDHDPAMTRAGDLLGTPLYMAPEQLAGAAVGPAADLWALGSVLHECLTGRPAAGPDGDRRGDVPAPLRRLIAACRERDPARRPASAAAVADGLTAFAARCRIRSCAPGVRRAVRWLAAAAVLACVGAVARPREAGPEPRQPTIEERLDRLEHALGEHRRASTHGD